MRNYDVSHWSVTDRFGHRVAAYLRTNVKPMRNTRPIVSFTFDDVPEFRLLEGRRYFGRARGQRYVLHRGWTL